MKVFISSYYNLIYCISSANCSAAEQQLELSSKCDEDQQSEGNKKENVIWILSHLESSYFPSCHP